MTNVCNYSCCAACRHAFRTVRITCPPRPLLPRGPYPILCSSRSYHLLCQFHWLIYGLVFTTRWALGVKGLRGSPKSFGSQCPYCLSNFFMGSLVYTYLTGLFIEQWGPNDWRSFFVKVSVLTGHTKSLRNIFHAGEAPVRVPQSRNRS